jgi:citrate lyase subunit beta/citryl-CoA lyase
MTVTTSSAMQTYPARSYLFVPGDRPERFGKALSLDADVLIIDLEDAVSAERKELARRHVATWLSSDHPVYLRVNSAETRWFREDLELSRSSGVAGVVLPKAQYAEELDEIGGFAPTKPILPMIETAIGFDRARVLAQHARVQRLIFGSIDFQVDLGINGDDNELLYFRSQLVLTSRLANLEPPVDGVTVQIEDVDRLRHDAQVARRLGFGGKLLIHPAQIATINEFFNPSVEEIAWAERITRASLASGSGAVAIDGNMVDQPIVLKAERILRAARSVKSQQSVAD